MPTGHTMKFGAFMAPFHRVGENPTLALDRDLELIQWLDVLGFDEVYVGDQNPVPIQKYCRASTICHFYSSHVGSDVGLEPLFDDSVAG